MKFILLQFVIVSFSHRILSSPVDWRFLGFLQYGSSVVAVLHSAHTLISTSCVSRLLGCIKFIDIIAQAQGLVDCGGFFPPKLCTLCFWNLFWAQSDPSAKSGSAGFMTGVWWLWGVDNMFYALLAEIQHYMLHLLHALYVLYDELHVCAICAVCAIWATYMCCMSYMCYLCRVVDNLFYALFDEIQHLLCWVTG